MNTLRRFMVVIALLAGAHACVAPNAADTPGVLVEPDDAARAELAGIIAAAVGSDTVLLADDALTTTSWLVIERAVPRGLSSPPIGERSLETPSRFRLFVVDTRCVLEHEGDGRRWTLTQSRCRAL
jgi:hypothetical protein